MTTKINQDNFDFDAMIRYQIGPRIANVTVTDSTFANVLNANGIFSNGGVVYGVVYGAGFTNNTRILLNPNIVPTSITYVSESALRIQLQDLPSKSYNVQIFDNSTKLGTLYAQLLTFSSGPVWTTAASLPSVIVDKVYVNTIAATSDSNILYTVQAGSTLPSNLQLLSNGLISGYANTAVGTYTFTAVATDEESQQVTRTFSIEVTPEPPIDAFVTGSNVSTITYTYNSANYIAHVFLESGTFQINAFSNISALNTVDMFLVGGGAGGAGDQGGGGGGGVTNNYVNVSVEVDTSYTVTVGGGGASGTRGGNTQVTGGSLSSMIAPGGGTGASLTGTAAAWYTGGGGGGGNGGGGGGGGAGYIGFGGGTAGIWSGGGGGGMGSAGGGGGSYCGGGMGGNGLQFAQYAALGGSPAGYFGGGGRGGAFSGGSSVSTMTNTATGGGGNGKCGGSSDPGTGDGVPGTGGGGGGGIGNDPGGAGRGGTGGHGIVIIRYPTG